MQTINCNIIELSSVWKEQFKKALDDTLTEMVERIKTRTPIKTGNLRDNWERTELQIQNLTEYAGFVEDGTIYQRPVGMMKVTVLEFNTILEEKLQG